jgi:hypothetical protein
MAVRDLTLVEVERGRDLVELLVETYNREQADGSSDEEARLAVELVLLSEARAGRIRLAG